MLDGDDLALTMFKGSLFVRGSMPYIRDPNLALRLTCFSRALSNDSSRHLSSLLCTIPKENFGLPKFKF